jgi:medium-chain acyl-[acyl-carrier-protein] hydrolase
MNQVVTPWIVQSAKRTDAALRLFCFPYAGGGASVFRGWPVTLSPQIDVCPIQLPGHENRLREKPFDNVFTLVKALADALQPELGTPFALFGHSMGAVIGFELARHLRREYGLAPCHLFVSGRRAPHLADPGPPLHRLPAPAFIEGLRQRYNGIPAVILQDEELMRLFLPVLRADVTLLETYQYMDDDLLDCPISAYGGLRDSRAGAEAMEAWQAQTRGAFSLRMFLGGHFFLQTDRELVLQTLNQELVQTLSGLEAARV